MTTTSQGGAELGELLRAHGAELHRLAAMLTGEEALATALTARTLAARGTAAQVSPDRLRQDLVRHYIRSAPRRPEGVRPTGADAGEVLRRLRPRVRAVCALLLVEGWDADRAGAAVGMSGSKVSALVPSVPGLDLVLIGLADQHSLVVQELEEAVLDATPSGGLARTGRRGRGLLVAASLSVALVAVFLVAGERGDADDGEDGSGGPVTIGRTDLTEAGWRLNDEGDPPRLVNGLSLRETVTLDGGGRRTPVSVPDASGFAVAAFGVLWCDMPPAEDDHLVVPTGTLSVDGAQVVLPCAGRDGSPPVTQLVPLPPAGEGVLEVEGDLPGKGTATLALYQETDSYGVPPPRGSLTEAPPVEDGAVTLDLSSGGPSTFHGWRTVQAVSVGHDSTVRVWAGRSGSITVLVDGVPATDDGDVAAMMAMADAWTEPVDAASPTVPEARDYADWSTQQADVRDGRWLVPVPGAVRTFRLPEGVLPPPGEHRTVAVEVLTESVEDHLQVVVTEAQPAEVDTAPVLALSASDAPEFALGHRLVGQWKVPSDGYLRELTLEGAAELPDDAVVLLAPESASSPWFSWGESIVSRGGTEVAAWLADSLDGALVELRSGTFSSLPAGPGTVSVAAPPSPGQPPTTVLAYQPVSYEEFDFAAAAVPPDAWPAGSVRAPDPYVSYHPVGHETVDVVGSRDLDDDGAVTVSFRAGRELSAQVTTEGRGRMRFLLNGQPADALGLSEGWWSSWTEEPVTSQVWLGHPGAFGSQAELTVVVEDYEDFTVEVLVG